MDRDRQNRDRYEQRQIDRTDGHTDGQIDIWIERQKDRTDR